MKRRAVSALLASAPFAVSLATASFARAQSRDSGTAPPGFARVPLVESRCVIEVVRVRSDSVQERVLPSPECSPLRLELLGPPPALTRPGYHGLNPELRVPFAVRNVGTAAVRSPIWAYSSDRDLQGFQRGAPIPDGFAPGLQYWWSGSGERDAPDMWLPSGQRMEMSWTLGTTDSTDAAPEVISAGDATRGRTARFFAGFFEDRYLVPIRLRALRPTAEVPAEARDSVPGWLLSARMLPAGLDAPVPFLWNVLVIRFPRGTTAATRQLLVDRLGGVVVGGRRRQDGEGDYYVQLDDSSGGAPVLAGLRFLKPDGLRSLARAGVFLAPREVERRLRARHQRSQPLVYSRLGEGPDSTLAVFFAGDATREEREETAALVGGDLVEEDTGYMHLSYISVGDHVSGDSLSHAARRLGSLAAVDQAFVNVHRRASDRDWGFPDERRSIDTSSAVDPEVRRFVRSYHLPQQQAIIEVIRIPERELVVFEVSYGPGQDCALDCFYSAAAGLKYGPRIGWLSVSDYSHDSTVVAPVLRDTFTVESGERYLFSEAVEDAVRAQYPDPWPRSGVWDRLLRRTLVSSALAPREMLLRYARGLYRRPDFLLAADLTRAATQRRDDGLLTLLAGIPEGGDPPLAAGRALLALAPALVREPNTPAATLFELAQQLTLQTRDSGLADIIVVHPNARSNIAVLTVLAEWSLAARERLLGVVSAPAPVLAVVARLFDWRSPGGARTAAQQLMADPAVATNQDVLTVLANMNWHVAFMSDPDPCIWASRRLADTTFRRWDRQFQPILEP